ncbi:MAG TPA: polyhydroxyalkanoate depolymerase [Stellaceae bacterium]|nr:polyhydroxyalkanoate depolymerase [Stellaceae bacterium]
MLYEAYQAQSDVMGPFRIMAQATTGMLNQPWPAYFSENPMIRGVAAACEMISRAGMSHARPPFGLDSTLVNGKTVAVAEEITAATPFCSLLHFAKDSKVKQPRVLVVAPMSGHFSTLLRGTVETLLTDHDVWITDWVNARNIPLTHGAWGLDDFIETIVDFVHLLGPDVHIVAVCQPSVPVLAATALMAAANDPIQPRSMVLMGGPIDTRVSPTQVNELAMGKPIEWFEQSVIGTVPMRYPGAFRRVYPGFMQLAGFMTMNLDRHVNAHVDLFKNLIKGDDESAEATKKFYDEYTAVMDLPAEFYLETIKTVFQDYALPLGKMVSRNRMVEPKAIERTALMTVEGERDDICAPGQTVAAHDLCTGLAPEKKLHHLQMNVGHYGVFNGKRWRTETYPKVREFIRANA